MIATNLVLLVSSFVTSNDGWTALSSVQGKDYAALGGDYAAFHGAGFLLNHYPASRLYDLELQADIFHQLLPRISRDRVLYFAHPPFLAVLLRPLAVLPLAWGYAVWLVVALACYLAGLRLIWNSTRAIPRQEWPMVLLLALSFQPFLMECWRGGQLAFFGFFWVALALWCWKAGRPFASGLALGFCLYKPTFLVLILPMLVVGRQFRCLAGFLACALGLGLASVGAVGWRGCQGYLDLMMIYSRSSVSSEENFLLMTKFVDLSSFLSVAGLRNSTVAVVATAVFALATLGALAWGWWRVDDRDGPDRTLLFATTFTLTMVVNIHVAAYDLLLIVPGLLVAADLLYERRRGSGSPLTSRFKILLVMTFLVTYFAQFIATKLGLQIETLLLAALGWYQLALGGVIRQRPDFADGPSDRPPLDRLGDSLQK